MTLILTKEELQRIRDSVRPIDELPWNAALEKKKRLKALSDEKVKNWPNTLEALRKKKESFLKDRAAIEEMKRQEIDKQEAEMRREARLEAIRKANDLLYDQTDKMKMLKSQRLYADVIHNRVGQIEVKKKVKDVEKEQEAKYHEETLRQVADGDAKERAKIAAQQRVIEEVKVDRQRQRDEARAIREEIQRKNNEEGMRMRKDAQERLEEEQREYVRRQQEIADGNIRTAKANAELKRIREELAEQERIAQEAREAEKDKIEYRKNKLKELERQRFEKAQVTRQKMIDRAVEELAKRVSNDEAVLEKQVQEQRDREEREYQEKQRKAEEMKQLLAQSRNEQIAAREKEQREQQIETDALLNRWRIENETAMETEKQKQMRAREATVKIKTQQYEDGKALAAKRAEEKLIEIEQARFLNSIDNQDDKRFIELCKAEIARNVSLGKPIYTLLRALQFEQPQLLASKTVKVNRKKEE